MKRSPYTIRLADGVPMAFPASHSLDDILNIARQYANGEAGATRGRVEVRRDGRMVASVHPYAPSFYGGET